MLAILHSAPPSVDCRWMHVPMTRGAIVSDSTDAITLTPDSEVKVRAIKYK